MIVLVFHYYKKYSDQFFILHLVASWLYNFWVQIIELFNKVL
jgi:hypothetical protein